MCIRTAKENINKISLYCLRKSCKRKYTFIFKITILQVDKKTVGHKKLKIF